MTPSVSDIYTAIELGSLPLVEELLRSEFYQKASNLAKSKGLYKTPLHKAFCEGKYAIARALINSGLKIKQEVIISYPAETKYPAEHTKQTFFAPDNLMALAIKSGNPALVDLCLKNSFPVDGRYENGQTFLMQAFQEGAKECAILLMSKGANPYLTDNEGKGCMHYATLSQNPEMIRVAVKTRLDINSFDRFGQTALYYAENLETAKELLSFGALLEWENTLQQTPIFKAIQENNLDVFRLFIANKANMSHPDVDNITPEKLLQSPTHASGILPRYYEEKSHIMLKQWYDNHQKSYDTSLSKLKVQPQKITPPYMDNFQPKKYWEQYVIAIKKQSGREIC